MMNYVLAYFTFIYTIPFFFLAIKNEFSTASLVGVISSLGFYVGISPFLMLNSRSKAYKKNIPSYGLRRKPVLTLACCVLVLYLLLRLEFLSSLIFDPANLFLSVMETMQSISEERYKNGFSESESLFYQIGTVFFYLLMGLIGVIFTFSKGRKFPWVVIASLLLFVEMLEGTRARAVIGLAFLFTEYLFSRNSILQGRNLRYSFKSFGLTIACLLFIFAVPQYARVYDADNPLQIIFLEKLPGYSFAAHDAFRVWVESWKGDLGFGVNTFAGVLKLFGFQFQQGFYDFVNTDFGATNLFTILRNLYADFGIIVTPIVFVTFGFLLGYVSTYRAGFLLTVIAKFVVVLVLFFMYSVFIFFNAVAGFILLTIVYFFLKESYVAVSSAGYGNLVLKKQDCSNEI